MVLKDSVQREPGSLTIRFVVSDFANTVPVQYTGVLPDLFKEGYRSRRARSARRGGEFVAKEVLAKHDENYMPPEVTEALEKGRATASE